MKETTGPQQHRSLLLIMGAPLILFVMILPACGPGIEDPEAFNAQPAIQKEQDSYVTPETTRAENQHSQNTDNQSLHQPPKGGL